MGQAAAQETREIPHGQMGTHRVMNAQELLELRGTGNGATIIAEPGSPYKFTTADLWGDGAEQTYEGTLRPGEFLVEKRQPISGQQPS
jgi:predicted heme/steroid binding protein